MTTHLAYYNELDKYAAQWLRNLIDAGHIVPGIVDERSIEDVRPIDLHGFTQCHFFAGVGVWSLALRRAGWSDDRAVWTASCPCQPFSTAGEGAGFADERHLWPHLYHLVEQRRPAIVLGEQVASKDADPWVDLVHTDLEAVGYAFGAVAFPSAGIGAPHIRDRTYWVANASSAGSSEQRRQRHEPTRFATGGMAVGLGNAERRSTGRDAGAGTGAQAGAELRNVGDDTGSPSAAGGLANAARRRTSAGQQPRSVRGAERGSVAQLSGQPAAGPTNGLWRDADWLLCRDGKWRPVEPGTFPLAHGATARVGRLRAYGNAINAEAARVWIETVMDCLPA